MAYGRSYGYNGPIGQAEDPLASAIYGLLGGFERGQQWRRQRDLDQAAVAEQERRRALEDEDRQRRDAQIGYEREQDALNRQERADARRDEFLQRAGDQGVLYTGDPKMPFLKTGPTKRERDMELEAGVRDRLERPDLVAEARSLGIGDADAMTNPQLRVAIASAMSKAKAAADDAKSKRDFDEQQRLKQTPTYSDLHPQPKESDIPTFLRPDAVSSRAATLTRPWVQNGIEVAPGLPAEEAATAARRENETQRQAAFEADRSQLRDLYKRAYENAGSPEAQDQATRAYMAALDQLAAKYGIGRP